MLCQLSAILNSQFHFISTEQANQTEHGLAFGTVSPILPFAVQIYKQPNFGQEHRNGIFYRKNALHLDLGTSPYSSVVIM